MFVQARAGESFEELYRRFKRGMEASGLLREYRKKQRSGPRGAAGQDPQRRP
jgi:ribosomal protein S21